MNCLVWDCKPDDKDDPINWVELKTSAEIENDKDNMKYERKLMKFWIQSFLLGVPKIIVGFRSKKGILQRLEELETKNIPTMVRKQGRGTWDGNLCINFTASFLDCKYQRQSLEAHRLTNVRVEANDHWGRSMAHQAKREVSGYRDLQE